MATPDQILTVARSQLGYREAANGANKYGAAYGVDRVAWCAQYCWWVFRQAGAPGLIHPKTAYTPTLYDWYRQRGRTSTTPQVGSLVFYNWPGDGVNRIQHVGIVEAVEPAAIITIEGNTSQGTAGSQSDGGGVWRRRRARNSSIVGFGHPAYSAAPAPNPAPRPAPTPEGDLFMALSDAEQREILDGIRRMKPGIVLPARSPHCSPKQDDYIGSALNAWAEAANTRAGVDALHAKLDQLIALVKAAGVDPAAVTAAVAEALGGGLTITGSAVPKRAA